MSHLRLVYSAPNPSPLSHPCLDAFDSELDYVYQTLLWLGASAAEVEDLAYEVFLALHRDWKVAASGPLRPYLFAVAYRIASGRPRRRRRREPATHGEVRAAYRSEATSRAEASQDSDDVPPLQAALDRVPLPRRAVLILHDVDHVPIETIAGVLSLTRFATRRRLQRARVDLLGGRAAARDDRGAGVTREVPVLGAKLAALISAGKAVPRQPEAIRARAIVRARAALATGAAFIYAPVRESRRRRWILALAAAVAFVVGAAGATLALRASGPPVTTLAR